MPVASFHIAARKLIFDIGWNSPAWQGRRTSYSKTHLRPIPCDSHSGERALLLGALARLGAYP